ncbi:autophagy-related 2 [Lycorma delicatula]|uniref:autophagy-related 2 n=1 Tax=Lycorma delicatula TaxID=130591 RepID=UPI003F519435
MPWFFPFSDSIKKRACRYLLQRYLGQFLDEKLTLDQLTVDLYNGKGSVTEVYLDVQALNSLGEKKNFPFEFVDGYIDKLSVKIPWSSLLTDSSSVEVEGMVLTIQPKERVDTGMSMFESMWSSMTSSIQMAAECMQQESKEIDQGNPLEGLERFAQAIDSILTRVQVNFKRTLIRVEHLPKDCNVGVRLEVQIMNVDYCDEAGMNSGISQSTGVGEKTFQTAAFTASKFSCEGISFYTDEFAAEDRIESRSYIKNDHPDLGMDFVTAKSDINNRVMVSRLAGRQEIRVKLKQGVAVLGPKVEFELNLGSLIIFSSPRQLHLLSELASGFESATSEDTSLLTQPRTSHKPMDIYDFQRIEQQLMHQLHPANTNLRGNKGLQCMQGWSTAPMGGDESDDEFQPAKGVRNKNSTTDSRRLSDSIFSDATSLEGSVTSNSSSATYLSKSPSETYFTPSQSTTPTRSKSKRKGSSSGDSDPNAEVSSFHISIGSVVFILLHEDIMTTSPDTNLLAPGSVADMSMIAKNFFQTVGLTSAVGCVNRDFNSAKEVFVRACQHSHIRLLAAPVIIEGDEKTTSTTKLVSAVVTAASVEVLECLIEKSPNSDEESTVEYVELLKFMRSSQKKEDPQPSGPLSSQPDLWLHFKRVERIGRSSHSHIPHIEISVNLQQCWSEIDISIVDRISTVLSSHSICKPLSKRVPPSMTQNSCFSQAVECSLLDTRTDLKIKSPFIVIKLRIPIPDLRPAYDLDKIPWWKRSVRDDILLFHLSEAQVMTGWNSSNSAQEFDLQCKEISAFFQEGGSDPVPFARATSDEKNKNSSLLDGGQMYGLPRFVLKISPWQKTGDLEDLQEPEREDLSTMMQSIVMETPQKEPSPFSAKKIVHESDTPHSVECEGEKLIIPGDKNEMSEFINVASQNTRIQVDVNLPCLAVHFPSKHLYEVIYNRVNSDLLLWESSAPKQRSSQSEMNSSAGVGSFYPDAHFSTCKPGTQYDEDEDDVGSDSESNGSAYYRTWEPYKQKRQQPILQYKGQSKFAITVNVGQGRLNSCTSVREGKCSEYGEILMSFRDINLFSVTSYEGFSHNNYICLQINYINLHHNGNVNPDTIIKNSSQLDTDMLSTPPNHLHSTIYKSEQGVAVKTKSPIVGAGSGNSKDMFSLAIRSHYDDRGDKIVRVACGIRGATLRHRVTAGKYNWFNQLLQFFEVMDYPVPGYNPPQVITELHQHLWDCAIDYRPLNLPLRSVVTMGNLSISSNMIAKTNSSTLRFIAEEVCLFISDKTSSIVDLQADYVCVLDIGLFELSLRLADNPRVDLRASNNIVHITTCSDSARALGQLITYFACDGDLVEQKSFPKEEKCSDLDNETINTLSDSTAERVNSLMEDAMLDVHGPQGIVLRDGRRIEGVQVFFFPDEKGGGSVISSVCPHHECDWAASDIDSDSDFCILDHEAGSGMIPQSGLPEIRMLTNGPVQIVDNHFSIPVRKTDHLQAPRNYPPPVLRYALREMTLVWHMYGGKDFQAECPEKKQVKVVESENKSQSCKQDSSQSGTTVTFSTAKPQEVNLHPAHCQHHQKQLAESDIPSDWKLRGGKGRQHDVLMELQLNKVRFHYEVYGKNCVQASRQVLIVQEFEIRDRLKSSQINKFLYQYTSETRPKQSQANMITIKAVHLRPDPKMNVQECCLKVTMLPLRLNIDQDSLLFLLTFCNEISGIAKEDSEFEGTLVPHCSAQAPVMSVESHEPHSKSKENSLSSDDKSSSTSSSPIFFRSFVFTPEVPIRLDYEGKRVDMTHGPLAGLLMGLGQLSCSELRLKRLEHKHGLLGLEKLLSYMFTEWFQDIKKNQLPNLIGGVGPIHSLIQLFQGIIDLFWLPIEQYQKDGRIVRGLQRGANSFTTSTAMAALEITTRLVQAIQSVAETAFDMVSPGPSVRKKQDGKTRSQPADIREGVSTAISLVREGLGETAHTLVRVASAEHETKGAVGAVGGVLRQLPPTVVAPIVFASAATNKFLGGVRSQLVPDARREHNCKWK